MEQESTFIDSVTTWKLNGTISSGHHLTWQMGGFCHSGSVLTRSLEAFQQSLSHIYGTNYYQTPHLVFVATDGGKPLTPFSFKAKSGKARFYLNFSLLHKKQIQSKKLGVNVCDKTSTESRDCGCCLEALGCDITWYNTLNPWCSWCCNVRRIRIRIAFIGKSYITTTKLEVPLPSVSKKYTHL